MPVEFVRELNDYGALKGGSACLVKRGADYFVVSSLVAAFDHGGPETLAFASDETGEVKSFLDVAGGRGMSRKETISQLEEDDDA